MLFDCIFKISIVLHNDFLYILNQSFYFRFDTWNKAYNHEFFNSHFFSYRFFIFWMKIAESWFQSRIFLSSDLTSNLVNGAYIATVASLSSGPTKKTELDIELEERLNESDLKKHRTHMFIR